MSHFNALMERLKVAEEVAGVSELARRSGLVERTVRRLLKKPPTQIQNLEKLDAAAAEIVKDAADKLAKIA